MRLTLSLLLVVPLLACRSGQKQESAPLPVSATAAAPACASNPSAAPTLPADGGSPEMGEAPCPGEATDDPLVQAAGFYDAGEYAKALACASLAAALAPESASALAEQAAALVALGHLERARVAFSRALALAPEHLDALHGSASLYLSRLAPSHEYDELGLAYAARGRVLALQSSDRPLAASFALLEAMGLNALGRSRQALARAEEAAAGLAGKEREAARMEKARALWESLRFAEAKAELEALLESETQGADAHYLLALVLEREGSDEPAASHLARARALEPQRYPPGPEISPEGLAELVSGIAAELPEAMRRDLRQVALSTQDLPDLDDLQAADPPLSPGIIGLFRGVPLGEPCPPEPGPCRAIVLYRKNLLRAVDSRQELVRQTRITLVHEIGHLRGEDDLELIARGLE